MHMKNLYKLQSVVLLAFILIYLNGKSQVNFTIAPTACAGSTQTLSLVSGTVSVLSNTWAALPVGPIFSAANSTLSTVNFPTAGIYTIAVAAITSRPNIVGAQSFHTFSGVILRPYSAQEDLKIPHPGLCPPNRQIRKRP